MSLKTRLTQVQHPLTQKLLSVMMDKKTNLALSADVTTKRELLALADQVGPFICVLKTHIDIVEDFDTDLIHHLQILADKHQFLLFEDRKFADIGHTVQLQYDKGIYQISDWAHLINAHTLPGPSIIEGLKKIGNPKQRGLLLLAEMSAKDNLIDEHYRQKTINLAQNHDDFVIGFIAQHRLTNDPKFIHFTPGIHLSSSGDTLGQQYLTPEKAICVNDTDIIIVGRNIYTHPNPVVVAQQLQQSAWEYYEAKQS